MSILDDDEAWLTPDEKERKRALEELYNPDTPIDAAKARTLYNSFSEFQRIIILEIARTGHYEPFWTANSKWQQLLRERSADRLVAKGVLLKSGQGYSARYVFTQRVKDYKSALEQENKNADR